MGYVYKITNTVNNKSYIGISIHEPEKRRIKEHLAGRGNRCLANAVKKYGKEAFTYEILEANVFDEFLPDLEVAYIANFNTVAPQGYNLNSGGDHAIPSADSRRKMSESSKNPSAETRRKISESLKNPSAETRRKMSEAAKKRRHSEDTRRKMSESRKGEKNHFFGKTHTAEARQKVSKANKNRIRSEAFCQKISASLKGRPVSEETRRKIAEAQMHPDQIPAREFFFSLSVDVPLKEKRKLLYTKFPNVKKGTIYNWVRKWLSD